MAELLIASSLVAVGYILSGNKGPNDDKTVARIPSKSIPNGDNIFNSNRVNEIRWNEQKMSNKNYKEVFSNKNTGSNLVVPGPTQPYFNKVDYTDNTLPIEFQDNPPRENVNLSYYDQSKKEYGVGHPTGNPVSDGWYGVSLTGEPIDPKNFAHNNMTPFFGSHVRQNVDEYTNNSIVENFTGQNNFDRKKDEIPNLFDPEANITNPYGMSNLSGYQRDRYIVSNKRNNEAPTEKIYVGPGLNKGYTWCPSGGFQQAETRDYVLPKTVDELRVKTNPKLTYNVPVIPGSKPSRPGKIGVVQKNRPDSFSVWNPDRYFITTGDRIKPKQNAEIVLKHSNRATTDIRRATGPAGPAEGFSQQGIRSNIRVSDKNQYTPGGPRGVDRAGGWTIPDCCPEEGSSYVPMKSCDFSGYPEINKLTRTKKCDDKRGQINSIHDYGRSGISCAVTNREETSCIPNGNIVGVDQQGYVPITSDLRHTRKEDVVGNTRWASNIQLPVGSGVVWDPNDIPRTTIKETLIQDSQTVNMSAQRPSNAPVYDPNDIPRTTIKETTLTDGRLGGIHRQDHLMPQAYNPTDVPKTTNKETTMTDYSGNAYYPNEDRRDCNQYDAPNTNRQFTSDVQYIGNAAGDQEGAYQVTDIDPRYTNRQYTSNNAHTGNGGTSVEKPRQNCMMENVITSSEREVLSKGRVPAREGPKDSLDPGMVHATTSKNGDYQNTLSSQRPMMSTKVYNSLPQANDCGQTKNKKTVNNSNIRNRLDASLLDEFRKNPYSQSLSSYWTY
jgi:hypothetical protein